MKIDTYVIRANYDEIRLMRDALEALSPSEIHSQHLRNKLLAHLNGVVRPDFGHTGLMEFANAVMELQMIWRDFPHPRSGKLLEREHELIGLVMCHALPAAQRVVAASCTTSATDATTAMVEAHQRTVVETLMDVVRHSPEQRLRACEILIDAWVRGQPIPGDGEPRT